jgi:hypothetical protein
MDATTNTEEKLPLGLSAEDIAKLKSEHGFIFLVTVKDGEDEYQAICKEPTVEILEATAALGKVSELKGSMALYDNCCLKADVMISNRFGLKSAVIKEISLKTTTITATTKNL